MKRIGLIGGMSWESTAVYYRLLNQGFAEHYGPWQQPDVVLRSINFADLTTLQSQGDWDAAADLLAEAASSLAAAGVDVLAICANTMHVVAPQVRAVTPQLEFVDVIEAVADAAKAQDATSIALLGTKYTMELGFYSEGLRAHGLDVVLPDEGQREELQRIAYEELTQGVFLDESRTTLGGIAASCLKRGADVAALCCTEFGILLDPETTALPMIDSTVEHVRALLLATTEP
jgi:aspartate racemase